MPQIPIEVIQAAQATQQKYKVPASVTIAQWALESAWGQKHLGTANNYFGIKYSKSRHKAAVNKKTGEHLGGKDVVITDAFAVFDSLLDCFEDHGWLLANLKYYKKAMANVDNPDEFAKCLTGIYATDPTYHEKLIKIMKANNLYQYNHVDPVTGE